MQQEFTHIIAKHQNIIHKVCRIYRNTPEDREDLFQEVVYQLWKAFPAYRKEAKVSTWMYRIALSTAIARYRKHALPRQKVSVDEVEIADTIPADQHPGKDRLYRAIGQLSTAEKAIITLYLDDLSYGEMAEVMGVSANYIGVKLNRVKQKLKNLLNA